ncbi:MAG: YoaK family protein [Beijerinckiaceae bacterium]|jgi:uncharacterized membrane protein YoaK (UPF0700 family)
MTSSPPTAFEPELNQGFPRPRPRFAAANSLAAAVALSASAGFLDGFAYAGHGHTFASAMTGNMVLLGIALTQSGSKALAYVYPLLAYVVGVIAANLLGRPGVRRRLPASLHFITLLAEITVLAIVPFLPGSLDDHILVSVITVSTAMQNTSFRNIGTRTYNSVIMTGNLQSFSNALALGVWPGDRAAREQVLDLGLVIASFVLGAALGAYVTPRFQNFATLVPAILLLALAAALFRSPDSRPMEGSGASSQ